MAQVMNLQRKITLDLGQLRSFGKALATEVPEVADRHFSVALVSDDRMKKLNEFFRAKDSTTDVLSFPYEPDDLDPDQNNLGDIVISAEQAERQAVENDLTIETEIKQLILHGLLHLCGMDHETDEGEMNRRELELRRHLRI